MSIARAVNVQREDGYDVYVGRSERYGDPYFGNPIRLGERCPLCGEVHRHPGSTLPCYKEFLIDRLAIDDEFCGEVRALKGKTLGCHCKPQPCHGDLLARVANGGALYIPYMVGFTGTRYGMTDPQIKHFAEVCERLGEGKEDVVLVHGDCVGADAEAHGIAEGLGWQHLILPCNLPRDRAFCEGLVVEPPKPPLDRNVEIVQSCDILLGCPPGEETRRSGTWHTIRTARRLERPTYIIYPFGGGG